MNALGRRVNLFDGQIDKRGGIAIRVGPATTAARKKFKDKLENNENYRQFTQQLKASKNLLIFGDNAGEIVLNKLLIETIKKLHHPDIAWDLVFKFYF